MMTNEVEHEGTSLQLWLHVHVCVTHVSPDQWTWLSPPHSDTLTKHGAWAKSTGPTGLTIPHGPLTTWLSNPTSSKIPPSCLSSSWLHRTWAHLQAQLILSVLAVGILTDTPQADPQAPHSRGRSHAPDVLSPCGIFRANPQADLI